MAATFYGILMNARFGVTECPEVEGLFIKWFADRSSAELEGVRMTERFPSGRFDSSRSAGDMYPIIRAVVDNPVDTLLRIINELRPEGWANTVDEPAARGPRITTPAHRPVDILRFPTSGWELD
jgi:hypothetical protein